MEGKATTGSGSKPRDVYLSGDVERSLQQFANAESIPPREPFVDLSGRGVRAAAKRTAETAAAETGADDFRHVPSHGLRQRFVHRLLVDGNMNLRMLMQVGGWDSLF